MADKDDFIIPVDGQSSGERLDAFVSGHIPKCSRSLAAELIRKGLIMIDGSVKKPGYRVKQGDKITGYIPAPEPIEYLPEPIPLNIIYEDEYLIVIDKQAGLVVHPAPGHFSDTLVNGLLHLFPNFEGIGGKIRPGIVHRLDKDTTGLLVIAKNANAQQHLAAQFKSRTIQKKYTAIVFGQMSSDSGTIDMPIGRHPVERKKMSVVSRSSRPARTDWIILERLHESTLINIDLKTGRTHQIRVHFSATGHPVLGDEVYAGKAAKNFIKNLSHPVVRQLLHASRLSFEHPVSGERISFESNIPQDMSEVIGELRALCAGNNSDIFSV